MFFGHSWIVLVLILALVLILFGPGKLSQVGGAFGRALRDFRKTQSEHDDPSPPPVTGG